MSKIAEWAENIYPGASKYAFEGITFKQMDVIVRGLELGVDVEVYAKPVYNHYQMKALLKGLTEGIDVSRLADPNLSYEKMLALIEELKI